MFHLSRHLPSMEIAKAWVVAGSRQMTTGSRMHPGDERDEMESDGLRLSWKPPRDGRFLASHDARRTCAIFTES
jgi:hypothetical protein